MSQATQIYRNRRNGKFGELTEEQAAIWPELLERVDESSIPVGEVVVPGTTGAVTLAPAPIDAPEPAVAEPEVLIPASTDKTKDSTRG